MRRIGEIVPSVEIAVIAQLDRRKNVADVCVGYAIVESVESVQLVSADAVNGTVGVLCGSILEAETVVIAGIAVNSCLEIESRS